MNIVLIEIAVVIILLICLWLGLGYAILNLKKYKADIEFNKFCVSLTSRYGLIQELLETAKRVVPSEKAVDETLEYISKAKVMSYKKDGNERIIGYANAILDNTDRIAVLMNNTVSQDHMAADVLDRYTKTLKQFNREKERYNTTIKNLKHYVDVFPTSLMARFLDIRTMDFVK